MNSVLVPNGSSFIAWKPSCRLRPSAAARTPRPLRSKRDTSHWYSRAPVSRTRAAIDRWWISTLMPPAENVAAGDSGSRRSRSDGYGHRRARRCRATLASEVMRLRLGADRQRCMLAHRRFRHVRMKPSILSSPRPPMVSSKLNLHEEPVLPAGATVKVFDGFFRSSRVSPEKPCDEKDEIVGATV